MNPAPAQAPRVRVVVVNYNSGGWLRRCLAALQRQTYPAFEVVVVDNVSTDHSLQLPDDPRFRAIEAERNLGFAAGCNRGSAGARTPWLAMLNPDTEPAPDWLEKLLGDAAAHPDFPILGSSQIRAGQPGVLDGTGDCLSAYGLAWRSGYGQPREALLPAGEVFAACGAAMLIRRDWFDRLGGFEERFFCYVEDVDLCFRARLLGARVWQSGRAVVEHAGGVSSGSAASAFARFHGYRNLAWMLMRCLPRRLLGLGLAGYLLLVALQWLRPQSREQRDALVRGARAGLSGYGRMRPVRHHIQRSRVVGTWTIARWLSWNPLAPLRRELVYLASASERKEPSLDGY